MLTGCPRSRNRHEALVLVLLIGIVMIAFVTSQVVNEARIKVGAGNDEQA